jgi:hypothetical protein
MKKGQKLETESKQSKRGQHGAKSATPRRDSGLAVTSKVKAGPELEVVPVDGGG